MEETPDFQQETATFVRDSDGSECGPNETLVEGGDYQIVNGNHHHNGNESNGEGDHLGVNGGDTSVRGDSTASSHGNNDSLNDTFGSSPGKHAPTAMNSSSDSQQFFSGVSDASNTTQTPTFPVDISATEDSSFTSDGDRSLSSVYQKDPFNSSTFVNIDSQEFPRTGDQTHEFSGSFVHGDHALPVGDEPGQEGSVGNYDGNGEDCPVTYAIPVDKPAPQVVQETETFVRNTDQTTAVAQTEEKIAEVLSDAHPQEPEWQDITGNGALMKKTIKKGQTGTRPVRNSVVTVKCNAIVLNNDFDSAAVLKVVDKHEELRFTISDLEVIQGLEIAVQLMDIGEIAEIKIEPRLAYGELGFQEKSIPSDASLLYTVELLKVEPPVDLENISISDRILIATNKVDSGNFWYNRKEAMLALSLYQKAISVLEAPNDKYVTPEDIVQLNSAKARAYGNLSSAQVEERIWDEGLRSVVNALRYDPNNGKLWCRKIKIFREKGQYEEAVEACEEVLARGSLIGDSFTKRARDELSGMRKKKRQADEKEKAMYQRMLGGSPKPSDGTPTQSYGPRMSNSTSGFSSSSNRKWLFYTAAAAVAAFGVVVAVRYYQQHH